MRRLRNTNTESNCTIFRAEGTKKDVRQADVRAWTHIVINAMNPTNFNLMFNKLITW